MRALVWVRVATAHTQTFFPMAGISINSLVKHYGAVQALRGVDVEIASGELFFLLGASGCGKTTLLRCIAGLETPTSGSIHFGQREVTRLPAHKREAAMMFQSYALWPHMTVGQNIAFGLEERKVPKAEIKQRVEEALEMVQLAGYAERGVDQMSGGQQQRVALARALVVRPKCLLLDEPLSNLDARLRIDMRQEIRRIVKENGLTAVYVTHDQEEALSMADRMAVFDVGEIRQIGTPEEIYRRPLSAQVASFIGETNVIEGECEGSDSVRTATTDIAGTVSDPTWTPQKGEKAIVSIRPEALSISEGTGLFHGKVIQRTYLGSIVRYTVEIADGTRLDVAEMNEHNARAVGDEVVITAAKDDILILR